MNNHDQPWEGGFRIFLAWMGLFVGTINVQAFLTLMALFLTIVFTLLQIYKIWHDIRRQKRIDALGEKLQ